MRIESLHWRSVYLSLFGSLFAQVCSFPEESGLVRWLLYHPLESGRGEAVARAIAESLLADSLVQQVAYVHRVQYRVFRLGPWMSIGGEATPEGAFAFFSALEKALQQFPQQLSRGLRPPALPAESWPYRLVYEDTGATEVSPLAVSQVFFRYWREGHLRCVLRGRMASPIQRIARQLTGNAAPNLPYVPPQSTPLHLPPRQGPGAVYVRWQAPKTDASTLLALWVQAYTLSESLCQEKQLACQATWIPLPQGLELWIETALPTATLQRVEEFLGRPLRIPEGLAAQFHRWLYSNETWQISSWWLCMWGLSPAAFRELPPLRTLQKARRTWKQVAFAAGL